MAPAAAAPVTRVCHFSQVRAEPCPSSSYPACAWNAPSTRDRAAVAIDSARSRPRRLLACSAMGSAATSVVASQPSPACTIATASAAVAGAAGT